jgi:hypothetical protein
MRTVAGIKISLDITSYYVNFSLRIAAVKTIATQPARPYNRKHQTAEQKQNRPDNSKLYTLNHKQTRNRYKTDTAQPAPNSRKPKKNRFLFESYIINDKW